ncbi:hypothetical protein SAMN05216388_10532 [Halorientalis persicus]|uniref:Uncharacterized protein n=1 Tax=Halorientalis persicus TaxID=1367881 RepID=A0A1H8W9X4_9EURY|nr:hypothetical protein [Halorientalis persicus]SEP24466.1 hypothetical protein SAMN05216388_10532 [Halorientalis persicus]
MKQSYLRRMVVFGLVAVAMGLSLPSVVGHPDPSDHGGEHPDGPSFNETVLMFAGDEDSVTANASEWQDDQSHLGFPPRTDYLYLAKTADLHRTRPSRRVQLWNQQDFQDIPVGKNTGSHEGNGPCPLASGGAGAYHNCPGNPVSDWIDDPKENPLGQGRTVAVRPNGRSANSGPRGWIQDAHTSIFDITPSTRFLLGNGSANYIAGAGTVRGFADYRVELSQGDQDPSPDRKVFYEYESDSVGTCLLKLNSELPDNWDDPCSRYAVIEQGSNSQRVNISYTAPDQNVPQSRFILVGKITATATKIIKEKKTRREQECTTTTGPNGGTRTVCTPKTVTYWETSRKTVTTDVVTSDSRYINVYSPFSDLEVAHFPDGSHEVLITSQDPWLGLTLANESRLYSNYRFFSYRSPAWDQLSITNNRGQSRTAMSSAHPLQAHAYPYRTDGYGSDPGVQVLQINSGRNYTAPSLPKNVDLTQVNASSEFRTAQTLLAETAEFNKSHLQLTGLVQGTNISGGILEAQITEHDVQTPNLTVSEIDSNSSFTRFRVQLTAPDGTPIETANRDGNITFGSNTLQTDSNGQAEVTVPNDGLYTVEYNPAKWWKLADDEQPYISNSTTAVASGSLISFGTLFALAWRSFLFLLPLLSMLWLADQIPGVKAWPPTFLIFWK